MFTDELSNQIIERLTKENERVSFQQASNLDKSKTAAKNRKAQPSNQISGRHYSKEEVIQLIKEYSKQFAISDDLPLAIGKCESGYNQFAKNKSSSASGVFQYLASTWAGTDEGKAGLSVFDADANVRAAIKYIASRGHAAPWNASKSCWNV